jgi:fatty acid desaturase
MTQDQPFAVQHFNHLDYRSFGDELQEIKRELDADRSEADFRHLRKIERWGRLCTVVGYATAWILPNPISAFLISQGNFTRWTMVTHHVTHRGYDKTPGVPRRYTSKHFAHGWRRFVDWLDWIVPDAWDYEHNVFHHYYTGEVTDPDLVERNVDFFRAWRLPIPIKALVIAFFMCTWKLLYYAPNTIWILQQVRARQQREKAAQGKLRSVVPGDHRPVKTLQLLLPISREGCEFWRRAVLPYGLVRFVLTPLLFLPVGLWAAMSVLVNVLMAEIITNVHTFLTIVPSHAASDLYRFTTPVANRNEFYVRQVIGSANYRCGSDLNDFLHGWLNYQIEHHLWPDLSMRQYQQVQPRVKALCEKYDIPYVQESIFTRFVKLWKILLGVESMRIGDTSGSAEPADVATLPADTVDSTAGPSHTLRSSR